VRRGLLTAQEALENFGVVPGDEKATQKARARLRKERLSRAEAAPHPLKWTAELRAAAEGVRAPLAPGVAQQGRVAVSEASGAPLAVSPGPWIDGCPRIHNFVATPSETDVTAYLDPETGDLLIVDVAPTGAACSFSSMPRRWVQPSAATSIAAE
jgi:N-methylhydantoinase B